MVICDFCYETLFNRSAGRWRPGRRHAHHASFATWERSVRNPCTVCTLLLEHVRSAVRSLEAVLDLVPDRKRLHPLLGPSSGAAKDTAEARYDQYVRDASVEEALLEWLDAPDNGLDVDLPLYDAMLEDGGGRRAWLLRFQPREGRRIRGHLLSLPKQSFFVYGSEYDDGIPLQRPCLENRTSSATTFLQIEAWLKACDSEKHPHCRYLHESRPDDYVPTRLLDLGEPAVESPSIRLVETGNKAANQYTPYITLSYKWGYEANCLLKRDNRQSYLKNIPWDILPVTFQHAVETTRRLGVRYLWIDALCIIQKDDDDWLREAPMMEKVYMNSYLSLAAVSADNCEQGLFRARRPASVPPSIAQVNWHHHQDAVCRVVRDDFWRGELLSEPLYARGWVLQERMLAPRILHFQRRQLFWQCPTLTAAEAVPEGLSTIVDDDERQEELRWRQLIHRAEHSFTTDQEVRMHEIWRSVVESYTTCNLTFSSDKLMAIAGVATRMQTAFGGEQYLAGLWRRGLVEQLAWRVTQFKPHAGVPSYRAPSWAWTSVDGVVSVPARVRQRRDYTMSVQDDGVHLVLEKADNKVGRILFGSLTAKAELYRLSFSAPSLDATEWSWTKAGKSQQGWCRFFPDTSMREEKLDRRVEAEDDPVLSLVKADDQEYRVDCPAAMLTYGRDSLDGTAPGSFSGFALALAPVVEADRARQVKLFRRIGLISFRDLVGESWRAFRDAQVRREGHYHYVITLL